MTHVPQYPEPPGKVYLVGAGPGDPGLLTLRGCQCLARADLVLYDYLANRQTLTHARDDAEIVCLGKHGQGRLLSQDEVQRRMVEAARAGKTVVRLKGGDPMVFGRAGEEVEALLAAGVAYEIVPGITAAAAAASYAAVPITHRDSASAVAFVTGQQSETAPDRVDFAALAAFPGTIVFYMGVTTGPQWSASLIEAGKDPDTPVALVRRCSLPDQTVTRCRLGEIPDVLAPGRLRPPVVAIVGSVVEHQPRFDWFTRRPLFGKTVLITRPRHQVEPMRSRLEELGAAVIVEPAIEISPPDDWSTVDRRIDRLGDFDWVVFSSANGVSGLLERIFQRGRDLRIFGGVKVAAVGPATAKCLSTYHLRNDLLPEQYRSEALAEALLDRDHPGRYLLIRASRGREVLAETLTDAGGQVEQIVVYNSTDAGPASDEVLTAMQNGEFTWTTVTSPAIARSLARMFGEALHQTRLATISPLTSGVLKQLGFEPSAEAATYTSEGLIESLLEAESPIAR